ncbi:MAG: CHAP domain-containing protein [Sphingobacteriaceae bacterium]
MFKSHYLFKFLSAVTILFCVHAYGFGVAAERVKVKAESRKVKVEKGESRKVKAESGKREILRRFYTGELGVKELSGKNDGTEVEKYLRYVGLKKGNPWCAAFVCWALGEAGISNPKSGWSPELFPASKVIWQRSRSLNAGFENPQAGDVFGIWFSDKGRIAHVGFIDSWDGKWMISVEGNTNEAGSAEGDGVYRKRRLCSSLYQVSDFIKEKRI